jgi:hypothetical protein
MYLGTAVALALVGTQPATAQVVVREGVGPAVVAQPVPLTQAQRTTIYRTIIPQGRGRQPIIRERIVTEPVAPAPVVREVAPLDSYYYGNPDPYAERRVVDPYLERRVVQQPDPYGAYASAVTVGTRVAPSVRLAPLPPAAIAEVPAIRSYRYMLAGERVFLVDPDTGVIVAEVTP